MDDLNWLRNALADYTRRYPQETRTADRFAVLLDDGHLAYTRERVSGHLTASAWVLEESRTRVLLVHHRKLGKWLQPGGHADGATALLQVAQTEVREETGLATTPILPDRVFDLDIHPIPDHGGVPAHEHFDVRFLLEATGAQQPRNNHESHDARWVDLHRLEELSTEESLLRMREKARG